MSYLELILTIVGGMVAVDIALDLWLAYQLIHYRRERRHPGEPGKYGVSRAP